MESMKRPLESLYVHVPFCASRCDYCAFYSVAGADAGLRRAYLERLDRELAEGAERCESLKSVFVGGGTPSSLPADELGGLLAAIGRTMRLQADAEFTVECNPESLTEEKVAVLVDGGVNRVSLGVQSFRPELRAAIGRRGGLDRLNGTLEALRERGISSIGFDLIFAIPGQTVEQWRDDVRRACELDVCHLSTYELTYHEGTRLADRTPRVDTHEEVALAMWKAAAEAARPAGLLRYEVSNLARPGFECRHNQAIWHGATYLGCGPAAASFDGAVRSTNVEDLDAWLQGAEPVEDRLPPEQRAAEVLGVGLRTVRGWRAEEFRARTGFDFIALRGDELARLADEGLLELIGQAVRPTERGLLFADTVARRLL